MSSSAVLDRDFQEGIIDMKGYLKRKRSEYRAKGQINRPKVARLAEKNDPRYFLTPDEIERFFPVAKHSPNWNYLEEVYMGQGNVADIKYLDEILPLHYPPRSYFDEEELPFLLSIETPLRYPPIHFIRKSTHLF